MTLHLRLHDVATTSFVTLHLRLHDVATTSFVTLHLRLHDVTSTLYFYIITSAYYYPLSIASVSSNVICFLTNWL